MAQKDVGKIVDVVNRIEYFSFMGNHEKVDELIVELVKLVGYGKTEFETGGKKYIIYVEKVKNGFIAHMSAAMAKQYGLAKDFDGGLHGAIAIMKTLDPNVKYLHVWYVS